MIIKGTINTPWNINENIVIPYSKLLKLNELYIYDVNSTNLNWISRFEIEIVYDAVKVYQGIQIQNINPFMPEYTYWDLKEIKKLANKKIVASYQFNFWNTHGFDIINGMQKHNEYNMKLNITDIYSYDYPQMVIGNLNFVDGELYSFNNWKFNKNIKDNTSYYFNDKWIIKQDSLDTIYYIENNFTRKTKINLYSKGVYALNMTYGTKYYVIKNPNITQYKLYPFLAIPALISGTPSQGGNSSNIINSDKLLQSLAFKGNLKIGSDGEWNNYSDDKFIGIFEWLPFWEIGSEMGLYNSNSIIEYSQNESEYTGDLWFIPISKQTLEQMKIELLKDNNNYFSYTLSPKNILYENNKIFLNFSKKIEYTGVISSICQFNETITDNTIIKSSDTLPYYTDDYMSFINATKNSAETSYKNQQKQSAAGIGGGIVTALLGVISLLGGIFSMNPAMMMVGAAGIAGGVSHTASSAIAADNHKEQIKSQYEDKKNSAGMTSSGITKNYQNSLSDYYTIELHNYINSNPTKNSIIYPPLIGFNYTSKDKFNDDYIITIDNDDYLNYTIDATRFNYLEITKKFNFKLSKTSNNLKVLNVLIRQKYPYYNDSDIAELLNKLSDNIIKVRDF